MIQNVLRALRNIDSRDHFAALVISLFYWIIIPKPYSRAMWALTSGAGRLPFDYKNYYEEGMHFSSQNPFSGGWKGRTVSEFPILITVWPPCGKFLVSTNLLPPCWVPQFYCRHVYAFQHAAGGFRSSLLAFLLPEFFLTSPLLCITAQIFLLPTYPALSLGIISFCLFTVSSSTLRHFYLSSLLFGTLAVLIKTSALMPHIVLFFFAGFAAGLAHFKTGPCFKNLCFPFQASAFRPCWCFGTGTQYIITTTTTIISFCSPFYQFGRWTGPCYFQSAVLLNQLFPVFLNRPVFFILLRSCSSLSQIQTP